MSKIPKIIHYCWFGKAEIPLKDKENIAIWKHKFSEYEIKEWNEDNFDTEQCQFVKQAYENKQYAFVSDYARAKVLYEYGGIYMDTDVEVLKEFPQPGENGYMGFERRKFLGTAVISSVPKNQVMKELVDFYETHNFFLNNGEMDIVANVSLLTDIMVKKGLKLGGEEQQCEGFRIYPREVFYPKKLRKDEFIITDETCAVHHCNNSWLSDREKRRGTNKLWIEVARPLLQGIRNILKKIVGEEKTRNIEIKIRNFLK